MQSLPPEIVVYMAIFGSYDIPHTPVAEDGVRYVLVSEDPMPYPGWEPMTIEPMFDNPADNNRWCKMHPERLFPGVPASVYVDGNARFGRRVKRWRQQMGNHAVGVVPHPRRSCAYCEAQRLREMWPEAVEIVAAMYAAGMPRDFGLYCGGWIYRQHTADAEAFGRLWWSTFDDHRRIRDQLALTWALWQSGVDFRRINPRGLQWGHHQRYGGCE